MPRRFVSLLGVWQSYKSRKKRAYQTVTVSTITLPPVTTTKELGIQTCSSYCGSICYADTKRITGSTIVTETYENFDYSIETRLTYTQPPPNCTIPATDCRQLWSEYTTAQSSWSNRTPDPTVFTIPPSPVTPGCTVGCQRTTCSFGGGDKGIIPTPGVIERYYNSLQVYYFPETRNVSRDMCASTPTQTPVPFPTTDVTSYTPITTEGFAVVDGKTLYKGNVYISISQMEVNDNCGYTTIMEDVAFPVASSDVQSERGDLGFTSRVYPVNWADFIEPVPYSAYIAGRERTFSAIDPAMVSDHVNYCKTAICDRQVVYPHSFNPWILLPPAVKHLDPEFANCDLRWDLSFFDPPIALSAVPNFLETTASEPLPTPAKPASSVVAMPVQTGDVSYSGPPASKPTAGGQIPNESACHISTCPSNQGPASGAHGSNDAGSGVIVPAQPFGDKDPPGSPGSPDSPSTPSTPDPPGAPGAPAVGTSQPNNPTPARPQITLGPTLIPLAPDGHGLVIQSPTTFAPSSSAIIGGTTFHLQSGVLTMISSGEASTLTIGAASQNAIGTVVGLANGDFTIQTTASSLVFNIQSTCGERGGGGEEFEEWGADVDSDEGGGGYG
ncbi:hypothetical protein GRF29_213g593582 [Pseudopithomyces chartarum]|uniref:Uncharacterized protein n=1 Tax=Pseudopithomyces chartarum TaxID=1892770 RepID=A0AAN6LMK7_9PLEO|nr:hypothetical protein GRF29_213g593582 [Pseudopithomyces chartarum]